MIVELLRVEDMRGEQARRAALTAVEAVAGVRRAVANLADRSLRVERADETSLAAILAALRAAGFVRVSVLA